MANGTIQWTVTLGGLSKASTVAKSASSALTLQEAVAAGKAGTLTTRDSNDTEGDFTLGAGHGITDADTVCVFWEGGMRYGMDVTAVNVNVVSIGGDGAPGGTGDDLPEEETAVIVTPQIEVNMEFDGDDVEIVSIHSDQRASVEFEEDDSEGGTTIAQREIVANGGWFWNTDMAETNPLAGDPVGRLQIANGSIVAGTVTLQVLFDATP